MTTAPVLFVSHGAPTFATEPGRLGAALAGLGRRLSGVRAVLVVSPHWQTPGIEIGRSAGPETLHDFGGFPAHLYRLRYPAPGAPESADEAARLLGSAGFDVQLNGERGLDHGAWVPLMHLFPAASVPVFQVSLPLDLDGTGALELGRNLASLRRQGVLIVGSGSLTHNLYELQPPGSPTAGYALEFAHWVRNAVQARRTEDLIQYRRLAPHAARAHPTEEHYLPLLVALGASQEDESATVLEGDVTYGVLAMESYAWGCPKAG